MLNIADVAQLVEQDFRKVKVGGSIPLIGLIYSFGKRAAKLRCTNLWLCLEEGTSWFSNLWPDSAKF